MLSTLLITESFDDYYLNNDHANQKNTNNQHKTHTHTHTLTRAQNSQLNDNCTNSLIEYIDDTNYNVQTNEIKYKLFNDISSINIKNGKIELILNLPITHNVISINKIKLSNNLNKFLKDIYLVIDNNVIIEKDEIFGSRENFLKVVAYKFNKNAINCLMDKNIDICIVLNKDAINYIMNKNIFVSYSFMILKNKVKFL